jgi:gliding motility-associated-like protein
VNPPISLIAPNVSICLGDSAVLTATASGGDGAPYTYFWSNLYNGSEQIIQGLANDTIFTITVSDACSPNTTIPVNVTVNPVPQVDFSAVGDGCEPYVFVAYSSNAGIVPIDSWFWDFGDGNTSNQPDSTVHVYTTAGNYDVSLTVTSSNGCAVTIVKPGVASVYNLPTANFNMYQGGSLIDPPITSILSPTIDFINTSSLDVDSVYWNFGDPSSGSSNNSILFDPFHTYGDTGTYLITLQVFTQYGCPDSIQQWVTFEGEYVFFAPNAFTPNDDGDNDYFMPKGLGVIDEKFEMYIFNRWGDLIAEVNGVFSNSPGIGWDGVGNNGKKTAQMDVYIWVIKTKDINGDKHEYVGHVSLLK